MTKKIFLFAFFAIIFTSVFSQEAVFSLDKLEDRKKDPEGTSFLNLPGTEKNLVLVKYKKGVDAYLLSPDNEVVASLGTDDIPRRYDKLVGQTVQGDKIKVFLFNALGRYASLLIDFDTNTVTEDQFKIDLGKEYVIGHTSRGDKFYIFSLQKKSSKINVHVINHNGTVEKKEIDFSSQVFIDFDGDEGTVYDIAKGFCVNGFKTLEAGIVQTQYANPLETTSKVVKLYTEQDNVRITLDPYAHTYVLNVSLRDFSHDVQVYKKPMLNEKEYYSRTKSLLFNDVVLQFMADRDKMEFIAKDRKDKSVIKSYSIKQNEKLTLANTPILMEGGTYNQNRKRRIERTSVFLKKVVKGDLGISAVESEGNYQVTFGSTKPLPNPASGGSMMNPIGMPSSPNPIGPLFFHYHGGSFATYRNSKSVHFDGYFNKKFEHIEGKLPEHAFRKIDAFLDKLNQEELAETVIRTEDGFLCMYYDEEAEKIKGLQF